MSTLKELTAEKHKEAESQPFIKSIFENKVDVDKYTDYLYQLRLIYSNMELHANKLGLFEGIEDIQRTKAISLDFAELANGRQLEYRTRFPTLCYLGYLDTIRNDRDALMAHIYVRHMGDLFGGQMLAKLLPGPNHMYKFENVPKLISAMRERVDVSMAEEANIAFTRNIEIIQEYND